MGDGGFGFETSIDAGYSIIRNLALRTRLRGGLFFPDDDGPFGKDKSFEVGTFGLGADYYLMPISVYAGLTLNVGGVRFSELETHETHLSRAGVGFDLDIGKEWLVSRVWGFGVAVRFSYLSVAPANIAPASPGRLDTMTSSLLFSATAN